MKDSSFDIFLTGFVLFSESSKINPSALDLIVLLKIEMQTLNQ